MEGGRGPVWFRGRAFCGGGAGIPKLVAALEATTPRSAWAVIVENVEGATTVSDGEALLRLLRKLYELGFTLTPRPANSVLNIQSGGGAVFGRPSRPPSHHDLLREEVDRALVGSCVDDRVPADGTEAAC